MNHLIIALALLISSQVHAEEPDWFMDAIKVKNPNELAVFVNAGKQCPFTTKEAKEIVSGVLIRSRIKPLVGSEWMFHGLYLNAEINCLIINDDSGYMAFTASVVFGNQSVEPSVDYSFPFDRFGVGKKESVISEYKLAIENAITAFIKANFDL